MPHRQACPTVPDHSTALSAALSALRVELELPGPFPPEVLAAAQQAVAEQTLPELDLTDIEFLTIDPATSTDLDQALFIAESAGGYRVLYAIADVPSFVVPGGPLDIETRLRGQTFYAPDGRIPLHPEVISEDAGSLLPDQLSSAFVWDFLLTDEAAVQTFTLRRARIRSRAKLSYAAAQEDLDGGNAGIILRLLREVGLKRIELERQRGGASLNIPDQEIESLPGGAYRIVAAPALPVEDWNAQISLLTGMAAAALMLEGKVGILRTMPEPDERSLVHFRRQSIALGMPWDTSVSYGEYLRTLDPAHPRQLAILHSAGTLFRGAGYTAFDGDTPAATLQSAIGAPYAHATAPLRRLVDRFVLVICEALSSGTEVPDWARAALPELPGIMASSDQLAGRMERAARDTVEAALLAHDVGHEFDAVVIAGAKPAKDDAGRSPRPASAPTGTIQIVDPPVTAKCSGALVSGQRVRVKLVRADIASATVHFELVPRPTAPGEVS